MLIYLLRHGLTEYNAEKRYQGQRDIPLSACGPFSAFSLYIKERYSVFMDRIDPIISRLTLEQKARLCSGADGEEIRYSSFSV